MIDRSTIRRKCRGILKEKMCVVNLGGETIHVTRKYFKREMFFLYLCDAHLPPAFKGI
jgi:hypothetical protein